jgi:hypothetical protein
MVGFIAVVKKTVCYSNVFSTTTYTSLGNFGNLFFENLKSGTNINP